MYLLLWGCTVFPSAAWSLVPRSLPGVGQVCARGSQGTYSSSPTPACCIPETASPCTQGPLQGLTFVFAFTKPQSTWRQLSTSCLRQPLKLRGRAVHAEGASAALRITLRSSTVPSSKHPTSNWLVLGLKCRKPDRGEGSTARDQGKKKIICLTKATQTFTETYNPNRRRLLCQPFSPATSLRGINSQAGQGIPQAGKKEKAT